MTNQIALFILIGVPLWSFFTFLFLFSYFKLPKSWNDKGVRQTVEFSSQMMFLLLPTLVTEFLIFELTTVGTYALYMIVLGYSGLLYYIRRKIRFET